MLMWDPTADNSTFFPVGARHVLFKTLAGKVEKDVPNPPIIIQLAELLQADIPYISWLCTLAVTYIPCEYVYHRIGIKVASKMTSEIRTVGLGLLSEYWKCFWERNGWNDWTVQTAKTLDYGRCSSQGILLFFLFFFVEETTSCLLKYLITKICTSTVSLMKSLTILGAFLVYLELVRLQWIAGAIRGKLHHVPYPTSPSLLRSPALGGLAILPVKELCHLQGAANHLHDHISWPQIHGNNFS